MKTLLRVAPCDDGLGILTWAYTAKGSSDGDPHRLLTDGHRGNLRLRRPRRDCSSRRARRRPGIRAFARPLMQPTVVLMSPPRVSLWPHSIGDL